MNITDKLSYWQVFCLIFVLFSLFLMGDALFRWDGFRYYASFYEFMPSVAFVFILWTIEAASISVLIWLPLRAFEWFGRFMGWRMNADNLLVFICCFVLIGIMAFFGKRLFLGSGSTQQQKFMLLLFVLTVTPLLTWLLRGKLYAILESITPLVWLFSAFLVLSVPLVTYHIWMKDSESEGYFHIFEAEEDSRVSETSDKRPNIILVTFDALTARDMYSYGYYRKTTPFISEWVQSASLFTRAEAVSNVTSPTTASLMSGKLPWTHQVYHMPEHSKIKESNTENLAEVLKSHNYHTIAYVENDAALPEALGIQQSFHNNHPFSYGEPYYREWLYKISQGKIRLFDWIVHPANYVLVRLLNQRYIKDLFEKKPDLFQKVNSPAHFDWFLSQSRPPEPYFAWIHIMPPHDPYLPPMSYRGIYQTLSKKGNFNEYKAIKQIKAAAKKYQRFTEDVQPFVKILRDRYDEFIRYCDKEFEDFIGALEERKRLKNTVIILSSDHGESFEHGYLMHGREHLYEQVTHIPLIIKREGQKEGQVINSVVSQMDIPATILDLANIPIPSWMEGRSLVPLLHDEKLPSLPVFSMNFEKNRGRGYPLINGTVAVWEENYKLVHNLKNGKSKLFDLKNDPDELNNLFSKKPLIGQRLLSIVKDEIKDVNNRS